MKKIIASIITLTVMMLANGSATAAGVKYYAGGYVTADLTQSFWTRVNPVQFDWCPKQVVYRDQVYYLSVCTAVY